MWLLKPNSLMTRFWSPHLEWDCSMYESCYSKMDVVFVFSWECRSWKFLLAKWSYYSKKCFTRDVHIYDSCTRRFVCVLEPCFIWALRCDFHFVESFCPPIFLVIHNRPPSFVLSPPQSPPLCHSKSLLTFPFLINEYKLQNMTLLLPMDTIPEVCYVLVCNTSSPIVDLWDIACSFSCCRPSNSDSLIRSSLEKRL